MMLNSVNGCISIIIPAYNAAEFLPECLNSIANQTYKNLQVVVIDDCSVDNTAEVVASVENSFEKGQLNYWKNEKNSGLAASRNKGIELSYGEFILFVDADDWLEPDTCEYMFKTVERLKSDMVICAYFSNSRDRQMVSYPIVCDEEMKIFEGDDFKQIILNGMVGLYGAQLKHPEYSDRLVAAWAKMYRREIIEKGNVGFVNCDKVPSESQLFNIEFCLNASSACFVKKPLYHYRRNTDGSLTKKYQEKLIDRWLYYWDITKKMLGDRIDDPF